MSENDIPPVVNSNEQNSAVPPMVPPVVQGSNGVAVAALVFGIIGIILFPLLVFGITAIILGAIGMSKARKVNAGKGPATAGLILGIAAIVFLPILVSIALPALNHARTLAKNSMSMTNLNGIGKSMILYQAQYEVYPDRPGRLIDGGYASIKMFTNPKTGNQAIYQDGEIITDGYVLIMPEQDAPSDDIMAYETDECAYKGKVAILKVNGGVDQIPIEELYEKLAEQESRKQLPKK